MLYKQLSFLELFPLLIFEVGSFVDCDVDQVSKSEAEQRRDLSDGIQYPLIQLCTLQALIYFPLEIPVHFLESLYRLVVTLLSNLVAEVNFRELGSLRILEGHLLYLILFVFFMKGLQIQLQSLLEW